MISGHDSPVAAPSSSLVANAAPSIPQEFPLAAGGGWGTGRPCVVCEESVPTDQAQVEASFAKLDPYTFHARCFVQWWRGVSAEQDAAERI